jgi:hypothetical protein
LFCNLDLLLYVLYECHVYATGDCLATVLLVRLDLLVRSEVRDFAICVSPLRSFLGLGSLNLRLEIFLGRLRQFIF